MATAPSRTPALQSERVTFLTSAAHKAALDDYAARSGQSVGNVVREATARYIGQEAGEEAELAAIVALLIEALPAMQASLDRSIAKTKASMDEVDRMLREAGIRK